MKKAGPKKAAPNAGPAAEPTGAADDDDSALSGGTLSETEAKEKMQVLLGDEIFRGLQASVLDLFDQFCASRHYLHKTLSS